MKRILGVVVLIAGVVGCTREDDAEARRKLEHAKQELKVETRDAGRKLKEGAHEASQEIKKGSQKLKDDLRSK
ncbi:MAG: hypothetical protein ACR2NN_13670 [Bryobacteraceae bacterium]